MIKFINILIERYVDSIRVNKWNATKFGLIFGFMVFSASFTETFVIEKQPIFNSIVIAGFIATIMTIVWSIMSIQLVKRRDKQDEKKSQEYHKMMEERRLKAEMSAHGKKINNKKKKKHKRKIEQNKVI